MRLYGAKQLRNYVDDRHTRHTESRDGICWSVNSTDRYAFVKIQGSDRQILAYYPENWSQTPEWLKRGNAVRISHCSGNQGRIELIGHGILVPTAVPGSTHVSTLSPGVSTGVAITLGCNLLGKPNNPGMSLMVRTGSFRVANSTFVLDAIAMNSSSLYRMGDGGKMNDIAAVKTIDAASTSAFRIDVLQVGTDLAVDVLKGTTFSGTATASTREAIAGGHVELGFVLVYPNMTAITQGDINHNFSIPESNQIFTSFSKTSIDTLDTSIDISFKVIDQYNNIVSKPGAGYFCTAKIISGSGSLVSGSTDSTAVEFYTNSVESLTYRKSTSDLDTIGTIFQFTAHLNYDLESVNHVMISTSTST